VTTAADRAAGVVAGTILHIPRRFSAAANGGTERVLREVLPVLGRRGVASRIVTTRAVGEPATETVAGCAVERHPYCYPTWPLSAARRAAWDSKGGNLVSWGVAGAVARTPGVGLVHLHTGNRLGAQCLRAARRRGVPCVLQLHGGHFVIPPAERADLAAGDRGGAGLEWGRALSWWWDTRHLLANVDAVICVGHDEYAVARQRLPAQRVRFLPGGVDPAPFAAADRARGRQRLGIVGDRLLITCIARLDRQKDQATLVRAWTRLGRSGVDLALVGAESSPGYADELRRLGADAIGTLIIAGNRPPEEVADLTAAADLSVLPSRHEPFGLSCLEAWAAGTCLVAAEVGGPRWLLADGACGRLFPPGDDAALAAVLTELLDHPHRRAQLAAAGRARAAAEFTWERHVDRLLEIYREVGMTGA